MLLLLYFAQNQFLFQEHGFGPNREDYYDPRNSFLNDVIERLGQLPTQDALQLQRLKKRKLMLKDQIEQLKLRLVPDIPA